MNQITVVQKLKQSGWYPLFVFFFGFSLLLTLFKVKPFYDDHVLKGKITALKEGNRQSRQQVDSLRQENQSLKQQIKTANATQSANQSSFLESSATFIAPMLVNPTGIEADVVGTAESTDLRNEAAETANLQGETESLDWDSLRNAILDEVPPNQRDAVEAFFNDGEAYRESLTTRAERQSLQDYTEAIMEGAMSQMKTIMENGTEEERKALKRTLSDPARLKLVLQMVETSAANAMRTMEEAQRSAEELIEQESIEREFIEEEILTVE